MSGPGSGYRRAPHLRPDLRAILLDGVMWAVMVGIGESYFPAFVLAIGGSQVAAGLTATVPLVCGSVLQLVSHRGLRRAGSYRKWIVLVASVQAAVFVPLAIAAAAGEFGGQSAPRGLLVAAVFAAITVYWAAGQAGGPAWTTWVGVLVPRRIRARYFGRRTRANYAGVLAGVLLGGALLDAGAHAGRYVAAFVALFSIAAAARGVSAWYLSRYSQPPRLERPHDDNHLPLRAALARLFRPGDSGGRMLRFMLLLQFSAMVGGPFFTPYMIRQLHFDPGEYMLWLAVSLLGKMAALPVLGWLAHQIGARAVLWFAAVGIVPLSALVPVSDNAGYQLLIQSLGGVAWAAYELSTFLLLIERLPDRERTSLLTTFNLLNSLAIALGSLAGGALLSALGESRHAYTVVFLASGCLRLASLVALAAFRPEGTVPRGEEETITPATFRTGAAGGPVETGVVADSEG